MLNTEPKMITVRCPKAPKGPPQCSFTRKRPFSVKIALRLKKVCYKVSL